MSDEHTGLSHDLPEYVPNWPVRPAVVKVKAKVYKYNGAWTWSHRCPHGGLARSVALGWPKATLAEAYEVALKHARGCW